MDRGPPPPGGDQDRGPEALVIQTTLTFLAFITVLFRFLARAIGDTAFGSDDWTMLLALIFAVSNWVLGVVIFHPGYGRHVYYLELDQIIEIGRLGFVSELLVVLAVCAVKVSVALFLLRIVGLRKWLRISLNAVIVVQVVSTSAYVIVLFILCRPIKANWDPIARETASCLPFSALADVSYAAVSISVLTDFLCTALPVPIVWNLQMSLQRRFTVIFLLGLGVLATICGIVRMSKLDALNDPTDVSWSLVTLGDWTVAEFCIGIIAGSLPPCAKFFLHLKMKVFARSGQDSNATGVSRSTRRGKFLSKFGITHQAGPDYLKQSFYRPRGSKEQSGWSSSRGSEHSETTLHEPATPSLRKISMVDDIHGQSV